VAETYSLSSLAAHAGSKQATKVVTLPDSASSGNMQQAMRNGTQVLCKNPDGSQEYYLIDNTRSLPGGPIYLLRTRP
jgi:hypothetical protein